MNLEGNVLALCFTAGILSTALCIMLIRRMKRSQKTAKHKSLTEERRKEWRRGQQLKKECLAKCKRQYNNLPGCRFTPLPCPKCKGPTQAFSRMLLSRDTAEWPNLTNFYGLADKFPFHERMSFEDEYVVEVFGPFHHEVLGVYCTCGAAVGFEKLAGDTT